MTLGDNKQGVRSGPETLWFRGRFRFGAFRPRLSGLPRYLSGIARLVRQVDNYACTLA